MAKFPYKNILEGVKHIWTKSQGPDAEGAAVTANPLTVGYKDAEGKATGVTPTNMLPVGDAAAQAKLADILTKLSADPATQTTLAAILEKIIAAPATEAKQTALNALVGEVQAAPTANTLLARLKNLETKVDAIIADGVKLSGSNIEFNKMAYTVGELTQLTIPTYDGSGQVVHPSVVYISGGTGLSGYRYWMAFTPYPNGDSTKENPSIVASNDGITWVVPDGLVNPVSGIPTEGFYADPSLLYDGSQLILYWVHSGISPNNTTYRSTSEDGITWTTPTEVTGANNFLTDAGVIRIGENNWHGWYTHGYGVSSNDTVYDWQHFVSKDGISWNTTRPAITNINTVNTGHAITTYANGKFHHVLSINGGNGYHACLIYGCSVDGSTIKFDNSPLLLPQDWADFRIYTGQIVPVLGKHLLYISAQTTAGEWYAGVIEVRLNSFTDIQMPLNPKQRTLIDKLEIRNTTTVYVGGGTGVPISEFNYYKDKRLIVRNKLGVTVTVTVTIKPTTNQENIKFNEEEGIASYIVPNEAFSCVRLIDSNLIKILGTTLPDRVYISVKATEAPISGTFSMTLICD